MGTVSVGFLALCLRTCAALRVQAFVQGGVVRVAQADALVSPNMLTVSSVAEWRRRRAVASGLQM